MAHFSKESHRRPIRIGNSSGAIGDGIDQIYRLALSGNVDAITADYLAEFNIAWQAIEMNTNPDAGYEPNFLEQLSWKNGEAARIVAEKGIKLVHNGGGLNPQALATKVDAYLKHLGLSTLKVAWVAGDNVKDMVYNGSAGKLYHLGNPESVVDITSAPLLAANVYTGQRGIVSALEQGADIVICGRCCDASPVMGLAYWWHGWQDSQLQQMAGSLMAGHLIECGPYVTGGNYCRAEEISKLHHVGYPIAEISCDGTAVITKSENSNGVVTVDTCKAQLLYEIQGPIYLNPDVVAEISNATLTEIGRDRICLTGVQGLPPPPTAKLAICLHGGYQAELAGYIAGLDTDFKYNLMKRNVLERLDKSPTTTISIEKYGSPAPDPRSQKECTVQIRFFMQAAREEAFDDFRRAIFYNGMQGCCGLHLAPDWRTMNPRPYVKYIPALISQSMLTLSVHFVGSSKVVAVPVKSVAPREDAVEHGSPLTTQSTESRGLAGIKTVSRPLGDLVLGRSGDKGGNANIGLWVRDPEAWEWLQTFMTTQRLVELLADDWDEAYTIERCVFPALWAVHFVIKGILQEGVSSSSVLDGFGKSIGEFVRARHVDLPEGLLEREMSRRKRLVASSRF